MIDSMSAGASSASQAVTRGLVSVVVPTRDRSQLLEQALEAMSSQSYASLEVIVVDDGSVDGTAEVIRAAAGRDPRIRGIRQPRSSGAAVARNAGAAVARGEFLLFEDDDCRGSRTRIADLVAALESNSSAAYAYCWMQVIEGGRATEVRGQLGPWSIGTPYALIRAEAFRRAGGFDPELARLQDFDLWTRLLHEGSAVRVPTVLFTTLRNGAGISASSEHLRAAAGRLLDKYRDAELSRPHLAQMHRILGGRLIVEGMRVEALAHYRRSIRLRPWSARSWVGCALAALGSPVYRRAAELQSAVARALAPRVGSSR